MSIAWENSNPTSAVTTSCGGTAPLCFNGTDGDVVTTPSGGTPNYTVLWNDTLGTASAVSGLSSGTYTATITDANGWGTTCEQVLADPDSLYVNLINAIAPSCDDDDGALTADPIGGTGAYTYAWSPSGGALITIDTLSATNHTVEVTDANGCITSTDSTLINPDRPTVTLTVDSVTCFDLKDGTATATISNGLEPYTFIWSTGTNGGGNAGDYDITRLDTGLVIIDVLDASNCPLSDNKIVYELTLLTVTVTDAQNLCLEDSLATITAT
ncbi:MAG: SprB repeat-containing protein [Flavobacteriales bacterium]|nr:SprB repeat-containing protein [Flavobacteriales bacterium]